MRPSSRTQILQAAVRVTERRGITALTLEAAAEEAGLTKPGLMYHFRTRDDLLARWVPQPPVPDPVQLDLFLARLAADGLWLFEATRPAPLAPEVKQALIRRITALTEPPA